jgi:hypothetical protein
MRNAGTGAVAKSNLGNLTRQPRGSAWVSGHAASSTEAIPLDR